MAGIVSSNKGFGLRLALFLLVAGRLACGQTDSLTLSSGTTAANGTVSLSLNLTSPTGNEPAALQWTMTYPASNVLAISVAAGSSATNAGKTLTCGSGSGTYSCIAWGMNSTAIQNGAVAVVNLTIAAGVTSTPIGISNASAASGSGLVLTLAAAGGVVSGPGSAAPSLTSLSCNPTILTSGTSALCTVTLSQAAVAGTTVSLASTVALLPGRSSSVTVPAGSATVNFNATAGTITSSQNATIFATLNGISQNVTLSLAPPAASPVTLSSLACSPATLTSGASTVCTVSVNTVSPAGATTVSLSSTNTLLPLTTSTLSVPPGSVTSSFSVTAGNITSNQSALVSATLNGSSQTATISLVAPVAISTMSCNPTTLLSGGTTACSIGLNQAAPGGGTTIALSSNNLLLPVPSPTITVPAGSITAAFNTTAGSIASSQNATLTASLNGSTQTVAINLVVPVTISSLTCSPTSLASALSGSCLINLSQASPAGGTTVALSSNNLLLPVPASSITVPAGSATSTFNVTAGTVSGNQSATLTGTLSGVSQTATINLVAGAAVSSVSCNPTSLTSGTSAACTLTLNEPAPAAGATVSLSSSVALLPGRLASVTFAPGASTANFTATAGTINTNQTATIFAAVNGLSQKVTIALVTSAGRIRGAVTSLTCSPVAVSPAGRISCDLEGEPTASPQQVFLTSSSAAVQVPMAVTTRPHQSSLSFEALVDPLAEQQSVQLTATSGDSRVQNLVLVLPGVGPVLTVPNKQLAKFGTSVNFEVKAADPSGSAVQLTASGLPIGAVFDTESGRFEWTPNSAQQGKYMMTFTAKNGIGQASSSVVTLEVDDGQPALDSPQEIACSPNAIATVKGKWLSSSPTETRDPSGIASIVGDVRVLINGQPSPSRYSSVTEVDFLCPADGVGTQLSVAVETPTGITKSVTVPMMEASPAILLWEGSNQREERRSPVSFADSSERAIVRDFRLAGHPAQPGDEVQLWATGLGISVATSASLLVKVGQADAAIESVAPVPGQNGLYTIRFRVPSTTTYGNTVPLQLEVLTSDGQPVLSNMVTAAIEPVK